MAASVARPVAKLHSHPAAATFILAFAVLLCAAVIWGGTRLSRLIASPFDLTGRFGGALHETISTISIFGCLLLAGMAGAAACRLNAFNFGERLPRRFVQGAAIGFGGLVLAAGLAAIAGVVHDENAASPSLFIGWGTLLILLQAGSEEIFFRGWLQRVLVDSWGVSGLVVTAAVFALMHLIAGAATAMSVFNLFLGGLLFGLLAFRHLGIGSAFAAHFSWNWAEQLLFGLDPNPGQGPFGSILNLELVGSPKWGGSTEGLNASLAMTISLVVLLVPLFLIPPSHRLSREQRRRDHARA